MMTFSSRADEYEKWWSARHNNKGLNPRLGFWRNLYNDTRIIEVDAASIRVALKVYILLALLSLFCVAYMDVGQGREQGAEALQQKLHNAAMRLLLRLEEEQHCCAI